MIVLQEEETDVGNGSVPGMEGHFLPLSPKLLTDLERAVAVLMDYDGSVQIVCHDDADGICAGAVLTRTLIRAGRTLRTKVVGGLDDEIIDELAAKRMGLYIFADMGSGYPDLLDRLAGDTGSLILVLDHHKVVGRSDGMIQVNCNDYGINGSFECSGSIMAFLFSCTVDHSNIDLLDLALAGATGDKQKLYGFRGLNGKLAALGVDRDILRSDRGMDIFGSSIREALMSTYDPYFPGLSGNPGEVDELLGELGIGKDEAVEDIKGKRKTSLNSSLTLRLLETGVPSASIVNLIGTRYFSPSANAYIEDIAAIVNGCGSLEKHSLALGFCLSPAGYAREARITAAAFERTVLKKLMSLDKGLESLVHVDYFLAEKGEFGGTASGVAIRFITGGGRPLLSLSASEGSLKISARGTRELVEAGLDLAQALSASAELTGGRGGGHPVASGATIPEDGRKEFMDSVDRIVGRQLHRGRE